ncbi:MAG: amidase [Azospirillaceae bacterium]|nr:amidase [Azospirillaceae bacterium]
MSGIPRARTIEALAPVLRAGHLSPVDLLEDCLDRVAQFDGRLAAFVALADHARDDARAAERELRAGHWRGPLHGIPIALKDNYLTHDLPTTAGAPGIGIAFPRIDSYAARRLRQAGAILVGKTRTHQFAWGTTTPPTRNPWAPDRVPGGSSGGSAAAVAAGMCVAALGSDTGGSIRIPASLCGVVGLKATFGRISRAGVIPHSWSLDHAGPLTRCVADAATLLLALVGYDPADPGSVDRPVANWTLALDQPIRGLRIGVCRNHFFDSNQSGVEQAVEAAIRDLAAAGAVITDFRLPLLDFGLGAIFAIELASSAAYHDRSLRDGIVAHFEPDVRTLVEMGRLVSGADYLKAEQYRHRLARDFADIFQKVDVVVGPTTPLTAWPVDTPSVAIAGAMESVLAASWRLTYPYNLTGMPALSVPCGFDAAGMPIGLQIAGRPFDEMAVLRVAHAYERDHDWSDAEPALTAA